MSELATQDDTLRETLEAAFTEAEAPAVVDTPLEKTESSRDETGRFASKEAPVEKIDTPKDQADQAAPVVEAEEKEERRAPSSWKKETQAEWNNLPSHVKDDVLRRETDFHKGIEQYKGHAQRAATYDAALAPYAPMLQQMGVAPEAAIGELFKTYTLLHNGTPEELD
jgi:hypothetical protein